MNILDPQGPIGAAEKTILIDSLGIMLAIVVPTIVAIAAFAFWFRAGNSRARYLPDWAYSGRIELVVWSIPALTVILLSGVAWIGAHELDPGKAIASARKPLRIQVVSLDWKWLFIYPDQKIATVNTLTIPSGVPLQLELTSASVMNAFFIPQFGSMIYTMNGMTTRLNLQADKPGDYQGLSSHFSGDGFAGMSFAVHAVSEAAFNDWAAQTGRTDRHLNADSYAALARPSTNDKPAAFRLDDPKLFEAIATQKLPPAPGPQDAASAETSGRRMFGKLSWAAIPIDQPLPMIASGVVAFAILGILLWIVLKGHLPYLWHEWITSVDHKRIGVMYTLLAMVMLLRGFSDAIMMRLQQSMAFHSGGFLPPEHYNQVFSAHGTIMIFFVAMPFMIGLMNFVVPLQLGVRDVAFPTLNSVGFWLTATGALLVNISLMIGEFARTGWLPYPPLSELTYSPGVGVDYYCWALQISGIGTLVAGINLVTTILKIRTRGMSYLRMPMFCWTSLASNLLIVAAFPVLTATLAMLLLDRYLGFHFFTNDAGGNVMMFMNLIWAWGHPEVYILVLPAFGIFSEVISTFSAKPLFGYRSMVAATMAICILSFMVWLHHFFTMGAGADVNAIFGIATMIIAVPTGVKVFNWLFTMYGGRVRFTSPMLWSIGFMITFIIGGMTGVLLAVPPADFLLHNSLFLVAHFHNVIIGGVLFGAFAGYTYWFPKAFGFRLHEGLGQAAFWFWISGFYLAFMPLYVLGFLGMTRRMQHYDVAEWRPWLIAAAFGAGLILIGIVLQIAQLVVSIRQRNELRDATGDPWNGRSLEWATPSPPPAFNFAMLPNVEGEEAYWAIKPHAKEGAPESENAAYRAIEMPRNSPTGFVCAFFATVMGFALIWHIWWMVIAGALGAFATFVVFAWRDEDEYVVPAEEVARIDRAYRSVRQSGAERSRYWLMTAATMTAARGDPHQLGHGRGEDAEAVHPGPAPKRIVTGYGFWIFLLSDMVMFAAFFATYAVLHDRTAGGPGGAQLFDLRSVAIETGCLLLSSFTCGLASIAAEIRNRLAFQTAMAVTCVLGLAFLSLEAKEFASLVAQGAGPTRSAFLSAFFTLVGCHGLHVSAGILWLLTMMAQVFAKGFRADIQRRILCFALFWHALDIIWVAVFTVVYLLGSAAA